MEMNKQAYKAKMEADLAAWSARIQGLKAKVGEAAGAAKTELLGELAKLEASAKQQIAKAEAVAGERWNDARVSVERGWDKLSGSVEAVWAKITSSN